MKNLGYIFWTVKFKETVDLRIFETLKPRKKAFIKLGLWMKTLLWNFRKIPFSDLHKIPQVAQQHSALVVGHAILVGGLLPTADHVRTNAEQVGEEVGL